MHNTTSWTPSDALKVKNIASYAELKNDLIADLIGTNFIWPIGNIPVYTNTSTPPPGKHSNYQYTATDELQLQGNLQEGRLVWQVGGYFEMSKGIDPSGSQSPGNIHCDDVSALNCYDVLGFYFRRPTGLANWYVSTMDFLNVAAYGQSTYKFTDRLKGTVGVRYSRDRTTSDAEVANWRFVDASPPSLTPQELNTPELHCLNADSGHPFSQVVQSTSACAIHLSKTSSAPTWLVGLDYNLTQDMMVYGKYSRGYRHGVVVALRASSWGTHGTSGCRMSTSKGQCGHAHGGEALYRTISCALDSGG